jgi:hypothetical protein
MAALLDEVGKQGVESEEAMRILGVKTRMNLKNIVVRMRSRGDEILCVLRDQDEKPRYYWTKHAPEGRVAQRSPSGVTVDRRAVVLSRIVQAGSAGIAHSAVSEGFGRQGAASTLAQLAKDGLAFMIRSKPGGPFMVFADKADADAMKRSIQLVVKPPKKERKPDKPAGFKRLRPLAPATFSGEPIIPKGLKPVVIPHGTDHRHTVQPHEVTPFFSKLGVGRYL